MKNPETKVLQNTIRDSILTKVDIALHNVLNSICKILYTGGGGTGFLIQLFKGNEPFFCLMTCEHVITEKMIESKEEVQVYYNMERSFMKFSLNKSERFIKSYKYLNIDAVVIEILQADGVKIKDFFLLADHEFGYEKFINKTGIIPQYPELQHLCYSKGPLISTKNFEFSHKISTKRGSSGSPIFLVNSTKVIGIHFAGDEEEEKNYGNFIWPISESLKLDLEYGEKKYNNDKYQGDLKNGKPEGFGRYTWGNNKCYIGQWKNGKKEGKGAKFNIKLTKNKENKEVEELIMTYEGEFVNDKYDGKGKYIWKNEEYYIGEWSKGERNGKGTDYYKDNKIRYEGDFLNGKYHGNGKYTLENDEYYIGQFSNGERNGKGQLFYKNGKIKYEGEFLNDNLEGEGKYYYKNDEYYVGHWKGGKKDGKGIVYYSNNEIKYDGNFVNDKLEGYGKYIYENGDYYEGEWKNNDRNGRGTEYYKNGNIKHQGIFINDQFSS